MQTFLKTIGALNDETRLSILRFIDINGAVCVCDIESAFGMIQSRISRHLKILKDAGFLRVERKGRWAYYAIRSPLEKKRIKNIVKIKFNENEINFDQNYDMNLIEYIFKIIDKHFKVEIIQKLEVLGIDQAYWDIKINDLKFTLHYEHYLGVSLYIYKSLIIFPNKKVRAKKLLHEIYILIKKDELYS